MTSSPSPITNASTYSASGSGLYAQWPPAITIGCGGRAVLVADRHAGEIDQVQQVRVDELGREVEGEHVEVARAARWVSTLKSGSPAPRIDASMSVQGA